MLFNFDLFNFMTSFDEDVDDDDLASWRIVDGRLKATLNFLVFSWIVDYSLFGSICLFKKWIKE